MRLDEGFVDVDVDVDVEEGLVKVGKVVGKKEALS